MNSVQKCYSFVNKNSLLNTAIFQKDYNIIFYDMLFKINDYLEMMISNNILNSHPNFDHLVCVEMLDIDEYVICDTIKFNIDTLQFYGSTGNVYNINNNVNYMFNCVKAKLQQITNGNSNQNSIKLQQSTGSSQNNNQEKPKYTSKLQHVESKVIDLNKKIPISETDKEIKNKIQQIDSIIKNNIIDTKTQQLDSVIIEDDNVEQIDLSITEHKENFDDNNHDPNELLKMIQELTEMKNKENERLEQLKTVAEKEEEKLSELCNELGDRRRENFKNKEKEEENRNMFIANKKAYYLIKRDIESQKITESKISVLFKDYYPIYKFMDQKQLLDTDDEYIQYVSIYNELYPKKSFSVESYVPHNIHYLNEDEQKKYDNINNSNKDMIESFINNNTNTTTSNRKSLEEVLLDIDREDNYSENNTEFDDVTFDLDETQ
jgi:hypothetical protein